MWEKPSTTRRAKPSTYMPGGYPRESVCQNALSPRHVPDEVYAVPEVPVKRILLGESPDAVVTPASLANPDSIKYFVELDRA